MMDMSHDMVKRLKKLENNFTEENLETLYLVGDEEFLPIKEKYYSPTQANTKLCYFIIVTVLLCSVHFRDL
jgi:hypothetical protein